MKKSGLDAVLIGDNANLFYICGRVICGYVYIDASGSITFFVRRPSNLCGEGVVFIRKPEDIAGHLASAMPQNIGLEMGNESYATIERLKKVFVGATFGDSSDVLRRARSVKTPLEIEMMERSGQKHTKVYKQIPEIYRPGMTDIEFQIEIERLLRLEGCLGQFRTTGTAMEIFMSNTLTGANADTPSPFDFALGGAGLSPSLPIGANGTVIAPGKPVMVDANGNFNGYMTDMSRCFSPGKPDAEAVRVNDVSRKICAAVAEQARPGAATADLYRLAVSMAEEASLAANFMGYTYQAGFVGHGVGIAINESPVLAPRSREVLEAGCIIAIEPKFVVPGIGAVGVENTFVIEPTGPARPITFAPEEIVIL